MTKKKKIVIINGPNLNLLGQREPEIYGGITFESFFQNLQSDTSIDWVYFQSNIEGELINALQKHGFDSAGIVLNAGAYTHTSIGLRDAISAITSPVIEVHISNTMARESFRHQSLIAAVCKGAIIGFGLDSYQLAIHYLTKLQPC